MMTVGEKIRARRTALHMTMEELGEKIGVQRSAINKYEKDKIELKVSQIEALSKALDVSVFYLLDDDPDLPEEELRLLRLYRGAEETARQYALEMLMNHQKKDTKNAAI